MALVENAIVILMLVEDHLRLQSKLFSALQTCSSTMSSAACANPQNSLSTAAGDMKKVSGDCKLLSSDTGGLPLDVSACVFVTHW